MSGVGLPSSCTDHGKKGNKDGYQQVNPKCHEGFYFLHREVYASKVGKTAQDLAGIVVRHTCHNSRCINEGHLIEGTWGDNNRDRAAAGRSAKTRPDFRRLSDSDVAYIRANLVVGCRKGNGANAMSLRFGVDRKTIYMLRKGMTYFAEA